MVKKKRDKWTNNDLLSTSRKTTDWATPASQKTDDELGCFGKVGSFRSNNGTYRVTLVTIPVISHGKKTVLWLQQTEKLW